MALSHQKMIGIFPLHPQRRFDIADRQHGRRAVREGEAGRREGAEHINDHCNPGRRPCSGNEMKNFNLLNSRPGLFLVYLAFGFPFSVFISIEAISSYIDW